MYRSFFIHPSLLDIPAARASELQHLVKLLRYDWGIVWAFLTCPLRAARFSMLVHKTGRLYSLDVDGLVNLNSKAEGRDG